MKIFMVYLSEKFTPVFMFVLSDYMGYFFCLCMSYDVHLKIISINIHFTKVCLHLNVTLQLCASE